MKDQLLNTPVGAFSGGHLGLRWTRKRVGARELLELTSRAANDPEHLAVQRELEDPSGEGAFSKEKHLVGTRSDAERIRRPDHRGQALAGWGCSVDRLGTGNRREVDSEHTQKRAFGIEPLNPVIAAIAHIDVVAAIHRDGMRRVELS